MTRFGEAPAPRALLRGFSPATEIALTEVIPTVRAIASLREVVQREYELYVGVGGGLGIEYSLNMIIVSEPPGAITQFGDAHLEGFNVDVQTRLAPPSGIFEVPKAVDMRIARMVTTQLVPPLLQGIPHTYLTPHARMVPNHGAEPVGVIQPWLVDSVGNVIAGSFLRLGARAQCWCLPHFVDDPVPWVALAYEMWSATDPARFPRASSWSAAPRWQSRDEQRIRGELAEVSSQRERFEREIDAHIEALSEQMRTATRRADLGARRLLTAQGDDLKDAVAETLTSLGFQVTDVDTSLAKPGELLEDLQVRDSDWLCLVEVRGYDHGGGKTSDFGRIHRFRELHILRDGSPPDRTWYVVNQFAGSDPAGRPAALASGQDDVDVFEQSGGAVIETRILYDLARDYEEGHVSAEEARRLLRDAKGRLIYDQRRS